MGFWQWRSKPSDSPLIKRLLFIRDELVQRTTSIGVANMKMIEWFAGENKGMALAYEFFRPRAAKVDWFLVLWKPYILPKHRFTSWLLAHGRLRTADTIPYEPNKLCALCHQQDESNTHLFFDCEIVKPLLDKVKTWMDITFDITDMASYLDTFRQHYKGKGRQMKARHLALSSMIYLVWNARNMSRFENVVPCFEKIFHKVQVHVWRSVDIK
ncbi:uncharacterized protein LOC121978244 [Zingiber officinale]|uniref:uncharacterized protein LOC121978244 n=1 Tax=Zingiber officinale TaxID=94328 RepID=UPI001C4AEC6B|nr:uncharacterized protein LOC121978244 [Zingiber officinale]